MLQVKQVLQKDVDYKINNLAYKHCINVELPETLLSKHYSASTLANFIVSEASEGLMYALYEDNEPIGIYILEPTYPIHLDCPCVLDNLLFIVEDKRSFRHLLYLVKQTIEQVKQHFSGVFIMAVGSTLGSPILSSFYKRIGFSEAGTQLVLELIGTRQRDIT